MNAITRYKMGTLLAGKFRVLELLGQGGMGEVYRVEHERIKKMRALKVLHPHTQASKEMVERFKREATANGRIGHAHIVDTFDVGELDTGELYVEMEFLDGETLAKRIQRQGPLELGEICELIGQACEGVQAAHDAGIVHRDLKPANLMITERDNKAFVKLLDFGISRFESEEAEAMALTGKGVVLGSPQYMPPEQIRGQTELVDGRSDVYALGVVLYICAAGRLPFQAEKRRLLELMICEGKYEPLRALRPELPPSFCDLVAQAMAVDREHRIPSARVLGERLQAIACAKDMGEAEPGELMSSRTERIEDVNLLLDARKVLPTAKEAPPVPQTPPPARGWPEWVAFVALILGAIVAMVASKWLDKGEQSSEARASVTPQPSIGASSMPSTNATTTNTVEAQRSADSAPPASAPASLPGQSVTKKQPFVPKPVPSLRPSTSPSTRP